MNVRPFQALTPGYVDLEETEPVLDFDLSASRRGC